MCGVAQRRGAVTFDPTGFRGPEIAKVGPSQRDLSVGRKSMLIHGLVVDDGRGYGAIDW